MDDCIFCKIVRGEIPSKLVAQNERAIAFDDIAPKAPVHTLVIPKEHISSLHDASDQDRDIQAGRVRKVRIERDQVRAIDRPSTESVGAIVGKNDLVPVTPKRVS